MSINTIVIGAGWAGVVAARHLALMGRKVLVIDARNHIGGRAFTLQGQPGQSAPVDLGCSYIHGYNEGNPVGEIAARSGVKVVLSKPGPQAILAPGGGKVNEKLKENLGKAVMSAREHAREMVLDTRVGLSSYLLNSASPLFEGITDRTQQRYATQLASMLEIPLGASLSEVGMRWYGFEDNFSGSDAAPEGGFQSLVAKVFEEAKTAGADLKLGEIVTNINLEASLGVRVTTDKGTYIGKTVVCTIPLGVLQNKGAPSFAPPLPPRRQAVIARTKVGALNKLVISYPTAWWPKDFGSFVLLPEEDFHPPTAQPSLGGLLKATTILVVSASIDPSKAMLMLLMGADAAIALERFCINSESSELRNVTHAYLVERLGSSSTEAIPAPTHVFCTQWSSDPFAHGASTTPVQIGYEVSPLDFAELGKPLWNGKLGFAGEHTSVHHRGSVAGAVESGIREAERVERLLKLWDGQ